MIHYSFLSRLHRVTIETQINNIVEDVFNAQSNCSWNCVITPKEDAAMPISPLTILYVVLCSYIILWFPILVQVQAQEPLVMYKQIDRLRIHSQLATEQ